MPQAKSNKKVYESSSSHRESTKHWLEVGNSPTKRDVLCRSLFDCLQSLTLQVLSCLYCKVLHCVKNIPLMFHQFFVVCLSEDGFLLVSGSERSTVTIHLVIVSTKFNRSKILTLITLFFYLYNFIVSVAEKMLQCRKAMKTTEKPMPCH